MSSVNITTGLYAIDDDVAFSTKKSRKSKIMELPFSDLAVGQSFHVPTEAHGFTQARATQVAKEQASKLSAWCQLAGKRLNKRFSLRSVGSEDPRGPGLRIWRVEDKGQNLDALFSAPVAAPVVEAPKAKRVVARKGKAVAKPVAQETRTFNRRQVRAEARA